jgi:hypothetical protein
VTPLEVVTTWRVRTNVIPPTPDPTATGSGNPYSSSGGDSVYSGSSSTNPYSATEAA